MKYPEYDSPLKLVVSNITTQLAKKTDEECLQAIQRIGINVDKEKMIIALKHDAKRYREAYAKGHETGYTKRDEEIIRCKDCVKKGNSYICRFDRDIEEHGSHRTEAYDDWFCADGERKED